MAYVNFVNHCYVDTEVEMKEIYTSNHIWTLFENFTLDMAQVRGEGWVGVAQQQWLGWGQSGVTKTLRGLGTVGTLVGVTCGAGERSGLSGVTKELCHRPRPSARRGPSSLWADTRSPRCHQRPPCPHRCARSGRSACRTPRWRSTC